MSMTKKEQRWAFKHAKEHVLEALQEVLTDEHHSVMTDETGARRDDVHDEAMKHMERWFKMIKRDPRVSKPKKPRTR